jgi:hypothetical protein
MNNEIPAAEVIQTIRDLVNSKGTATLYVRTDKNRVVIVAVKEGEIITLSSGPKHGAKAIPVLREMRSAAVRLENGAIAFHSENMPATSALLATLEGDPPDGDTRREERAGARNKTGLEVEKVKAVLSQLLSEYLGPMAPVCCEQVFDSLGNSLDAERLRLAIKKMAAEAGSPDEAQSFTLRAWKRLNL